MDFSSLPEAQQQQLQQLQQQFEEHQRQQQQQQQQEAQQQQQIQDYALQAYDQSQVQAYDQSYYSYYQYQDPQQSQQSQQQQHAYYQADYANAYPQQPQEKQHLQPESAPIHTPWVEATPQNVESGGTMVVSGQGEGQVQHQQNSFYPQQTAATVGDQSNSGYSVPSGLHPAAAAAVAALSQLTQFAGTMDAAERAMADLQDRQWHRMGGGYGPMMGVGPGPLPFMGPGPMHHGSGPMRPPVGRFSHRGGGRRGGGTFRGGGRGHFGNRAPRSGLPFHGRGFGRGRGGPRRFPARGASSSSHPESHAAEEAELTEEKAEPSAENHEAEPQDIVPSQTSALAQGNAASNQRAPQVAWCELCRVDCTSLEILEQHKNGKRHRKNLQRFEELQRANKPVTDIQNNQKPDVDSNAEVTLQPKEVQEGEENKQTLENIPTEAVNDQNKLETDQRNDLAEKPEVPVEELSNVQVKKPWMNQFDNQRHGMKRKMRGGRGGKRMKTFDAARRTVEPPRPKVVIPLICDLCNVKCDTQEVFDRHLSGKKHISKLKRFEGHQAMYGPMGLQALYPPNPITQTLFPPQGPQQTFYGPPSPYPPPGGYMPPQAHHAALAATAAGPGFQQNPNFQVLRAIPEFGGHETVPKAQHHAALVEPETKQDATVQTYAVNGVWESEGPGLNPPVDNTFAEADQVNAVTHETVAVPDYGATSDHAMLPGLDMQAKEGVAD